MVNGVHQPSPWGVSFGFTSGDHNYPLLFVMQISQTIPSIRSLDIFQKSTSDFKAEKESHLH